MEAKMPSEKLQPNDFPVSPSGEKVVKNDGQTIADAKSKPLAEDIAERLNEDASRKEDDRWSA
jgi:hypothetical protein